MKPMVAVGCFINRTKSLATIRHLDLQTAQDCVAPPKISFSSITVGGIRLFVCVSSRLQHFVSTLALCSISCTYNNLFFSLNFPTCWLYVEDSIYHLLPALCQHLHLMASSVISLAETERGEFLDNSICDTVDVVAMNFGKYFPRTNIRAEG